MKVVLKSRQAEIMKCLIAASTPLDIAYFKEKFKKQDRTIRYDIEKLRELFNPYGIEICYLTKKGYYIPVMQKTACSQFLLHCEISDRECLGDGGEEERYQRIFLYLLTQKNYVTSEKLAEVYYLSRSTLIRFLGKMEVWFGNRFFLDAKKALGYRLMGDEKVLRSIAVEILSVRFRGSYTVEDWFMLLPEELKEQLWLRDISEINHIIRKMNKKYNIWISNAAYLSLLSYCIVRRVRLRMGMMAGDTTPLKEKRGFYDRELLEELTEGEGLSIGELECISHVLRENGIYSESSQVKEEILERTIQKVLDCIEEKKGRVSFDMGALYQDLFAHLKRFMDLSTQKPEEEDPYVLKEVREHYYFYFRLATECGVVIEGETGLSYGAMEVCYLAVYLYKNSIHTENDRKNVMVVCATGKGLSHLLTLRIKNVFPALNVVGQISPWQLSKVSDLQNVNFVISTIPLENSMVPVIKISQILSEEDIKRINDFLRYGQLVDDIPLNQKNEASFMAKDDPFNLSEEMVLDENGGMVEAATVLSKLILTLLEYTSKFPEKFQMSRDAMLGMIIHMSMAVPRWLDGKNQEKFSGDYKGEYYHMKEKHPDVFYLMEKFFELVERTLRIRISVSERFAFFLYIIEE